jgi:phage FluMu protein Com
MPQNLKPGSEVSIPCRHCDKTLIRFTLQVGGHSLTCPKCGSATEAKVYTDPSGIRVKTAKGPRSVRN